MQLSLKAGFVAGLFAAMLGSANLAHATVSTTTVTGDFTPSGAGAACAALYAHPAVKTIKDFGVMSALDVLTQISFPSPVLNESHAGDDGTTGNKGGQSIVISAISNNGKRFEFMETTPIPAGFDLVYVEAKEKIVFVHVPSATQGANYGDLTSPLGIISRVIFCSKAQTAALTPNPPDTCFIDQDLYNVVYGGTSPWSGPTFWQDENGNTSVCLPAGATAGRCCTACTSTPGVPAGFPTCNLVDAGELGNNECDQASVENGDFENFPFCRQASNGAFLTPAATPRSVNVETYQGPTSAISSSEVSIQSTTCFYYTWNNQPFVSPNPCR